MQHSLYFFLRPITASGKICVCSSVVFDCGILPNEARGWVRPWVCRDPVHVKIYFFPGNFAALFLCTYMYRKNSYGTIFSGLGTRLKNKTVPTTVGHRISNTVRLLPSIFQNCIPKMYSIFIYFHLSGTHQPSQ